MSGDTIITGLTAPQTDGLAYLRVRIPHVQASRSMTGSQVFASVGCSPDDARRTAGGVLR